MNRSIERLLQSPGVAGALRLVVLLALGYGLFQLALYIGVDVLLPLVNGALGTNLEQSGLHVSGTGPAENEIYVGRIVAVFGAVLLLAAITGLVLRTFPQNPIADDEGECPYYLSVIPLAASRCAHCGSDVEPAIEEDHETAPA